MLKLLLTLAAFIVATLTPQQRTLRASIAAHARWSREDPTENAARGQAGLLARFDREAEPGLTEAEYARRAQSAHRAHMARLSLASSKARAARKAGGSHAA